MGIQINGATDSITAIDGTIDVVSAIGNAGVVTATAFVGNITGNVTGNINHTSNLELQTGGVTRAHFNPSGHFNVAGISTFTGNADFGAGIDVTGNITATGNVVANGTMTVGSYGVFGSLVAADPGSNYYGTTNRFGGGISLQGSLYIDGDILHIGDTDTKIRFPINDTFTVETGGSERLRIDSSGNVLVGTTDTSLYNNGDSASEGIVLRGGDVIDIARKGDLQLTLNRQTNDGPHIAFYRSGGVKSFISTRNNAFCIDVDGTTERLRIHSDGKMSLGTSSSASAKFNISHGNELALYTSGPYNYQAKFESTDAEAAIVIEDVNSGSNYNRIGVITNDMTFITNNNERLRIFSNGSVGVGDYSSTNLTHAFQALRTSGSTYLSSKNTGGNAIFYAEASNGNTAKLELMQAGTGNFTLEVGSTNALMFKDDGTERLRIDNNGNLKQGTSNPGPFTSTSPTSGLRFLGNKVMQGCVSSTTTLNGSGAGTFDFGKLWTTDDTSIELFIQVVRNDSGNYTTHYAKAFINKTKGSGMSQGHILYQNGAAQSNGFSITGISAGGYTGSGGSSHGTQITVTGGAGGVIYRATCFYTAISKNGQWS